MNLDRRTHWEDAYTDGDVDDVSWFETTPKTSLEFIEHAGLPHDAPIIDIGAGASRLVDHLLNAGYQNLTILDIAAPALAAAKTRLGPRAAGVGWLVADVTDFTPPHQYRLWHDRAVFHFLTRPADRAAYVRALDEALEPGGTVVLATFALDGPLHCSGLDVARYDAAGLARELGERYELVESVHRIHETPWGTTQAFTHARFTKLR